MDVPKDHPRAESLRIRHKLTDGFNRGLVAQAGLIAHGRGEAFDYLLGEKTREPAEKAIEAAASLLKTADNPVVSVNGNAAALAAKEIADLAKLVDAKIEVNLFYRTPEREGKIAGELKRAGADRVFGLEKKHEIPNLSSERANVDDALFEADAVLVFLEDGDRTEALKAFGKKVIAVDLNPLSRTARKADVTIVDNIVRALPKLIEAVKARAYGSEFDNKRNLEEMEAFIRGSKAPLSQ